MTKQYSTKSALAKREAKQRIDKLKKEIEHHRYLYHVLDRQEISDAALDSLKHELFRLERQYPEFMTADSPTQRIGGRALDKFKKVKHKVRQWSLEDAFSEEEIRDWDKRIKRFINQTTGEKLTSISYNCELKIDGIHIILSYKKGILKSGATRGDGQIGEDITNNIKTIEAIPLGLTKKKADLVVEGEIFIRKTVFEKLNEARKKEGKTALANPRNAAAGAVRQLNPAITQSRQLDFFAYDISWPEEEIPENQFKELEKLRSLGFKVNRNFKLAKNINEVIALWKNWHNKKDSYDYWIDGLVAKVNSRKYQRILGFTGKAPRWALALKYPGEEATTIIEDIKLSLGRTGKITPVAILKPVQLAGTIVSRASLHNMDEIKRLDVRVGDTVIVYKAGDIIPQIQKVIKTLRPQGTKEFKLPKNCPICGAKIIKHKGEANHYCSNSTCASLEKKKLYHFVSKNGFNIDGLGPKIIDQLMDEGLISGPSDIFKLTEGDLKPLERFADKSAQNLINAINRGKKITFKKFLTSLGIKHVGSEAAILIEKSLKEKYGPITSLKKLTSLLEGNETQELENIKGIGPKIFQSLRAYFKNKKNLAMIKELDDLGVELLSTGINKAKEGIKNKSFIFTGSLNSMSRDEAKEKVQTLGGKTPSSLSRNIDYLVVGENPGSKYKKAKKLKLVKIITEEEFLNLIK